MTNPTARVPVPQWREWETVFSSTQPYENPFQDARLQVTLTAPSGKLHRIDGFWDGGTTWRARFMPGEIGTWTFETHCSDPENAGLDAQRGSFICVEPLRETRFDRHGAIRVSKNHRYLEHADGTPFFWLADTVWNGPLLSTDSEWEHYLQTRAAQKFNAAQWVTTQWIASPEGDPDGRPAFTGRERIAVDPGFFQRLDHKSRALNRAGMLSVPVLLWAASWIQDYQANTINPGLTLPVDQAILLERYMVARWGAQHVLWILNGDGIYEGAAAERWRTIGRGVFGDREHAPVSLHPGGWKWNYAEFKTESWLDLWGYQSSHDVGERGLRWHLSGGPVTDWNKEPVHPIINLEPPYEGHNDMSVPNTRRISAHDVRRAMYTSLLISPTAGVSYGGHGVWGWDDGTGLPTAHPQTGVPQPWQQALHLPVASSQIGYLSEFIASVEWWRLVPCPEMIVVQPGVEHVGKTIVAAKTAANDLAVIYTPSSRSVELDLTPLLSSVNAQWFNPVTGARSKAAFAGPRERACFETPQPGDWLLVLHQAAIPLK